MAEDPVSRAEAVGSEPAGRGSSVILVSACLLGVRCNHVGRGNPSAAVLALGEAGARLVPICPEVAGGLPTPRPAAALVSGSRAHVVTADGDDVTAFYERGAAAAVEVARAVGADRAILKARSPSCGCHQVYDAASGQLLPGMGVAASALHAAGFEVGDEDDEAARGDARTAPRTMMGPSGA